MDCGSVLPPANDSLEWDDFVPVISYLTVADAKKVKKAFVMSWSFHKDQKRRSGDPYFIHPVAVARILADMHADADTLIASLLHDALEDTPLSEDEIVDAFGHDVYRMIDALTKLDEEEFADRPTLNETTESIRKLITYMKEDVRIIIIKLADRLHNMQTVEFLKPERQKTFAEETHEVYVKIADRLSMRDMRDALAELCWKVMDPELAEGMIAVREENTCNAKSILSMFERELRSDFGDMPVRIASENFRFRALKMQLDARGESVSGVPSALAVFVCEDIDTCYRIFGYLHSHWKRETFSFEDYINAPSISGYRGIQTTLLLENGIRVRCKIRTQEMQEYAHCGIATMCFDGKPMGLPDYLEWSGRIESVTEGTSDRSSDFWESLQSDILGEAILVYGPGDQSVLLPQGASALDAAFYLFGDDTLCVKSITADGEEVQLGSVVEQGVTLGAKFLRKKTVNREWIKKVKTGVALSSIREALTSGGKEKKIVEGKALLEEVMTEQGKGLVEEFLEESLRQQLHDHGFDTINDLAIAIAEGRVQPEEAFQFLFVVERPSGVQKERRLYRFSFSVPSHSSDILQRLLGLLNSCGVYVDDIRMKTVRSASKIFLYTHATQKEKEELQRAFLAAGVDNILVFKARSWYYSQLALVLLSILWGLDCLLGKKLILGGVSPYDLTVLRFGVLFVISTLYYLLHSKLNKTAAQHKKLSPLNRYIFLSGGAIFLTALCSYIAVQTISALTYAIAMNIGVAFVIFARQILSKKPLPFVAGASFAIILAAFFLLHMEASSVFSIAFLTGLGCGIGFAIYSAACKRYQMNESVRSRYPIFLVFYSCVAFLLSLPLLLVSQFAILESPLLVHALLFTFFLTALPYILFFELQKYQEFRTSWVYMPLFFVVILAGEILFYETAGWILLIPLLLGVATLLSNAEEEKVRSSTA